VSCAVAVAGGPKDGGGGGVGGGGGGEGGTGPVVYEGEAAAEAVVVARAMNSLFILVGHLSRLKYTFHNLFQLNLRFFNLFICISIRKM
jgi:hypothetical protein